MSPSSRGSQILFQFGFSPQLYRSSQFSFQQLSRQTTQFSTSRALAKKLRSPPKHALPKQELPKKTQPIHNIPAVPIVPRFASFPSQLASRPSETLIFKAPSNSLYILGAYGFGAFCFVYAGINSMNNYVNPPPGLAKWVSNVFGVGCAAMAVAGTYLVLAPNR
jgi:hypothetical protein